MTPAPTYPPAAVLFDFDNVSDTVYDYAYPILAAAGFKGTAYATSGNVGAAGYISLAEYQELYAAGWDVANHSATHPYLANLSQAAQETELETCAAYLEANAMPRAARMVAYPNGSYNTSTLAAMAATGMLTGRTFTNDDPVTQGVPISDLYQIDGVYNLYNNDGLMTVAAATAALDQPSPDNLVIYLSHGVDPEGTGRNWTSADYAALVAHVKARGCRVVTISQLYDYVQAGYVWP